LPKFLANETELVKSSDRGTATHIFMQFCDFERLVSDGFEAELKRLLDRSFISSKDAELINGKHIKKFIDSDLLKAILRSKKVYREFRFNVMLPATGLSEDERVANEKVLVQGVIDSVFEDENGNLVLVDYKTDSVTEQNYIEVLTKKHKTQLSYYKKAIELMFERPVSATYIYSVPLGKVVEL
jgi:ATP-dependent helicase/nuclease subunit A